MTYEHTDTHTQPHSSENYHGLSNNPPPLPNTAHTALAAQSMAQLVEPYGAHNAEYSDGKSTIPQDLQSLAQSIEHALQTDSTGADMLFTQAQVLNTLFHRMIKSGVYASERKTFNHKNPHEVKTRYTMSEDKIFTALRAQQQCRHTVEAINTIKHMYNPSKPLALEHEETQT